jgi:hypothetical protein
MTQTDLTNHRTVRLLSTVTGILVALLAAGAFALSFDALQKLAHDHGVSMGLTWIWPLILDGAIVVFSLSVLRASLFRESVVYPMGLVACATAASLAFNVAHAEEGTLAKLMAAVPPLALFASFELVVRQIRSEVERGGCLASLSELFLQMDAMSQQRDNLAGQIEKLSVQKETLKLGIRQAKSASVHELLDKANEAKEDRIRQRVELVAELAGQGKSPMEIASVAGVSPKTVKRDMARLLKAA